MIVMATSRAQLIQDIKVLKLTQMEREFAEFAVEMLDEFQKNNYKPLASKKMNNLLNKRAINCYGIMEQVYWDGSDEEKPF